MTDDRNTTTAGTGFCGRREHADDERIESQADREALAEEKELSLQPLARQTAASTPSISEVRLQRAAVLLEIEAIQHAEDRCRDLTLRDLGCQYGIRHLMVASVLTASVLTLWKTLGAAAGIVGLCIALFVAVQHFVYDWELQHKSKLAARKAETRLAIEQLAAQKCCQTKEP